MHVVDLQVWPALLHHLAIGQAGIEIGQVHEVGKHRRQFTQLFCRGGGAGEFFVRQGQGTIILVNGDQALGEALFGQGYTGATLAFRRKRVQGGTAVAFFGRDNVRRDADVDLGEHFPQVQVPAIQGAQQTLFLLVGHHFHATGHHQVFHAGHDGCRRHVDGSDAAAAETVDGHAGRADVISGIQGCHAGDTLALLQVLVITADDDVVDLGGVQVVALRQCLEHGGHQALGVDFPQGALALFADAAGGAGHVDDPGF